MNWVGAGDYRRTGWGQGNRRELGRGRRLQGAGQVQGNTGDWDLGLQ